MKVRNQELDTVRQEQVIREQDEDEDVDDLRELLALLDASTGRNSTCRERATEEDDDSVDENRDTSNMQNKCVKTCSCTFPCCGEKNGKGSHRPGTCLNAPAKVGNVCIACTKFKFRKTKGLL